MSVFTPTIDQVRMTASVSNSDDDNELYQLLLDVQALIFKAGGKSTLLFSLFNNDTKEFMSEEYRHDISQYNFPLYGSPENNKILFKNITKKELLSDSYIVCKIYVKTTNLEFIPHVEILISNTAKRKKKKISNKWSAIPDNELLIPFGCCVIPLDAIKKAIEKGKVTMDKCHLSRQEPGTAPVYIPQYMHEKQMKSVQKNLKNEYDINSFHKMHLDVINHIKKVGKANIFLAPLCIGFATKIYVFYGNIDEAEQAINYELKSIYYGAEAAKFSSLTFAERIDTSENRVMFGEINDYDVKNYRKINSTDEKNDNENENESGKNNISNVSGVFGGKEQLFRTLISGYFRKMTEDNGNYHKFRDLISIVLKYGYIKVKNHPDRVYYRHLLYFTINKISKMKQEQKQEENGVNIMNASLVKGRNICVVVELRDNKTLQCVKKPMFTMGKNCIHHHSGALLTKDIQLPVMTNNSEPIWNQLYCLVLDYDVEFLKNLHFYFQFYNLSNKKAKFEGYTFLKLSRHEKKENNVNLFVDSDFYKLQIYPGDGKKINKKAKNGMIQFNYLTQSVDTTNNKKKIAPLTDHFLEIELNWKSDVLLKNW